MKFSDKHNTARRVAFARCWESHGPSDERVCFDPFAKDFLNWTGRFFSANPLGRRLTMKIGSELDLNILGYLALRTRIIDDYVLACVKQGFEQLVILGAGFDARAYRLEEVQGLRKVFELDLAHQQDAKLATLTKKLGALPGHVILVPIDFESQTLEDALLQSGFDPDLKTLFIWEGVSYYLEPQAVDQTLAFVANNSAPGSSIIFHYLNAEVVDGTSQDPLAETLVEMGANIGEHCKFGLKPESVAGFLSDRGFNCLGHFTSKECKEMYCGQSQRDRKVIGLFSIVQAATGNQTDGTAL